MDQNDIQQAIDTLTSQVNQATTPPSVSIPALDYTAPSMSDVSSQYQTFLNQAAANPDLINYYSQLLEQAQGDTQIAISQLENDYQTGTRNISTNLAANLQQLGLTFTGETESLQDTLNKRGIAVTQGSPGGVLTYTGAGGESGYEQSNLAQSQQLRQEAEQRTASQNVTSLANTLSSGITGAGQKLTQAGQQYQAGYEGDVSNMANQNMNLYTQNQNAQEQQALMKQATASKTGSSGTVTGSPQSMTQAQRQAAFTAEGNKGIAPVGFGG